MGGGGGGGAVCPAVMICYGDILSAVDHASFSTYLTPQTLQSMEEW